jgi:hypothetical protein
MTDYLTSNCYKAEDIEPGLLIEETISRITTREFDDGSTKPIIHFESGKGVVLNQTRLRDLIRVFGSQDSDWIGQKVIISRGDAMFAGKKVPSVALKPIVADRVADESRQAIAPPSDGAPPSDDREFERRKQRRSPGATRIP